MGQITLTEGGKLSHFRCIMSHGFVIVAVATVSHLLAFVASAEDKNNLRVTVSKRTVDRADGKPSGYSYQTIDRTMSLKASIKNIAMGKDLPEGKITCMVLIRSWLSSETGSIMRYSSETKLEPLKTSNQAEVSVGEYHIGGHMHGNLDHHVDQVAGWKISIDHGGKLTEFLSSPSFDSLNKRATDAVRPTTVVRPK